MSQSTQTFPICTQTLEDTDEMEVDPEGLWGTLTSSDGKVRHNLVEDIAYRIGRHADQNEIVINNRHISLNHCEIKREGNGIVILRDLSSNGTFYGRNGSYQKIGRNKSILLNNGDTVFLVDECRLKERDPALTYTFILEEVQTGPRGYDMGKQIGSGKFASVHLGAPKGSMDRVAIKVIEKKRTNSGENMDAVMREAEILRRVNHPNVVRIQAFEESDDKYYLVLEFVDDNLYRILYAKDSGRLSEKEARFVFRQILDVLHHLHAQDIVHRDLKLENILFDTSKRQVKVADFGLSRIVGDGSLKTFCGTLEYLAPEVIFADGSGYSKAVDMWAAGVILFTLLCGYPPFQNDVESVFYSRVRHGKFDFPGDVPLSRNVRHLISKLLQVDPVSRLSAAKALQHPWILSA